MGKKAGVILSGAFFLGFAIYTVLFLDNVFFSSIALVLLIISLPLFSLIIFKPEPFKKAAIKSKETLFHGAGVFNERLPHEKNTQLDNLAKMTEERLYTLSSVFPFDLFPNKIFIEQKQVIIIYSQFFWSYQDYHVLVEDILMPVVEMGPFFATLRLELGPGGFMQNPPSITFLKKTEALRAKRIIMGLLICKKEGIEFAGLTPDEIVQKVEEIGRVRTN